MFVDFVITTFAVAANFVITTFAVLLISFRLF